MASLSRATPSAVSEDFFGVPTSGKAFRAYAPTFSNPIGLVEPTHRPFRIPALLIERFRIPFAALDAEEVASVNLDGAGQPGNRIGHGVNEVAAEGFGILLAQGLSARGFQLPRPARPVPGARRCCPRDPCRCRSPPTFGDCEA